MSGLTRDKRTEPVSREEILRRERGQGKIISPDQLTTSRIGNNINRLMDTLLKVLIIHGRKSCTFIMDNGNVSRLYYRVSVPLVHCSPSTTAVTEAIRKNKRTPGILVGSTYLEMIMSRR